MHRFVIFVSLKVTKIQKVFSVLENVQAKCKPLEIL